MSNLNYESVLSAFQKIGARRANGASYKGARGISVSGTGQHFRFWNTEIKEGNGTVEINRQVGVSRPEWLSGPQGMKFFRALEEAKRSQQPIFGVIGIRSSKPDRNGNSVATSAAALLNSLGKPAEGTVIEADSRTGRLLVRFNDVQFGTTGERTLIRASQDQPQVFTTRELAERTAGGDAYIRVKAGEVKGLALRLDRNPQAPSIVIVGDGPKIKANAELFMGSGTAAPVYIKEHTNQWRFDGQFRAVAYKRDAETIATYGEGREPKSIAGILFLEREQRDTKEVLIRGRGFVDPALRVLIELAAVKAVSHRYESLGFTIKSVESENCGFDLLATRGEEVIHLEVKGTSGSTPRFFISRNERRCSEEDSKWRLVVVTNTLSTKPVFHEMTAAEAIRLYDFDALSWECTLRT